MKISQKVVTAEDQLVQAEYAPHNYKKWVGILSKITLLALLTVPLLAAIALFVSTRTISYDSPLLANSTIGQLIQWQAEQSGNADNSTVLLRRVHSAMIGWNGGLIAACLLGFVGLLRRSRWAILVLLVALIGFDLTLFNIPVQDNEPIIYDVLLGIGSLSLILLTKSRHKNRILNFVAILSLIFVTWEGFKAFAKSIDYRVSHSLAQWEYVAYPDLDHALNGLQQGNIDALVVQSKDVRDLVPPFSVLEGDSAETESSSYPDLRYLDDLPLEERYWGFAVFPELPGRFTIVVRQTEANQWESVADLKNKNIGALADSQSISKYFDIQRVLVLQDLKFANNVNLPHLQSIAEAMLQPARRNGDQLLVEILFESAVLTGKEAAIGFFAGSLFGFLLGSILAHSSLLRRGILPYLVASQTVPILAIAPMVVIWLGPSILSVATIAAYLTFFPVAINTFRGLQSPNPMSLDLIHTYAANRWATMWKVRVPAAVPYLFTAMKVAATSSVVGAIIGELPSSISGGLGRAILNLSSNYNAITTPKLWAAILMASLVGIVFFLVVSIFESIVLRWMYGTRSSQ